MAVEPPLPGTTVTDMHAQTAESSPSRALPAMPAAGRLQDGLFLHEAGASTRPLYIRFIARRFADIYGAQLYHFMPRLFGLHEGSGRLIAAFGLNDAMRGGLFVQRYFDQPVTTIVRERTGCAVAPGQLAEIGNLAGATPGALRQLIPVLTERLHESGYSWLLFTGPARLRNGFRRLGLPLQQLAPASLARLPAAERPLWGCYYEHAPAVMLGDVRGGYEHLQRLARSACGLGGALSDVAAVGLP